MNHSVLQFAKNSISDETEVRELEYFRLEVIRNLHFLVFQENEIISKTNPEDIMILTAWYKNDLIGFKIGYALPKKQFYSAKGCTHPDYRRNGIAEKLLARMILNTKRKGYKKLHYDTFPKLHPGMLALGKKAGFKEVFRKWNEEFKAEQIHLELRL